MKISTHFLLETGNSVLLPITKKQNSSFNYVEFKNENIVSNDEVYLSKQKSNSCVLDIIVTSPPPLGELKLTNQDILTWDDLWIDGETGNSVDPHIESMNLQRNSLLYVNMNLRRDSLKVINLEGNINLKSFTGSNLPSLEYLDFTDCINLESVLLGMSKNIKVLSLKNCRLTEDGLEEILSSFRPTKTSSANIFPGSLPPFRKSYTTMLDLRGNDIPWSNFKIASKIRLLVTNNWLVLWDNAPPTSVIPIQMYAFFPKNVSDTQIAQYYSGAQIQQVPPTPEPQAASAPATAPVPVPASQPQPQSYPTPQPQSQPSPPSSPASQPQQPSPPPSQPSSPPQSSPPPSQPSPPPASPPPASPPSSPPPSQGGGYGGGYY